MFNKTTDFSIFTDIPEDELNAILSPLKSRHLKKGHTLMFENDIPEHVYFIRSGMLIVYRMHEGQEIILGIITPGNIIGEIEILTSDDYSISSIEVLDNVSAWVITKQDFLNIIEIYSFIYKHARNIKRVYVYNSS